MSRFCSQCGTKLENEFGFCPECGWKIEQQSMTDAKKGKKNKTKRKKKSLKALWLSFVVIILLAAMGAGICVLVQLLQKGEPIVLKDFAADEIYFVCGEESEIVFTVNSSKPSAKVELMDNDGNVVGQMNDNGKKGDKNANDGIFTYVVNENVDSDSLCYDTYYCCAEDVSSESVTIYYFPKPTEESTKKAQEDLEYVREQVADIEKDYVDENGFVPLSERAAVIDDIEEEIKQWVEDGIAVHYIAEEDSIYIKFVSGLAGIYSPADENTDAVGSDVSMQVITCQPSYTEMGGSGYRTNAYTLPDGVGYVLEMLDKVGSDVDNTFDNYSFSSSNNYDDGEVTLDVINSFGSNQVILWHGHGYYGPSVNSSLVTGELFSWDNYRNDEEYYSNCISNRFVNGLDFQYSHVIITSRYIERYCENMENSFVYLAACSSGKSSELADAFLACGAGAVVANSETIIRSYNVAMLYETVSNMLKINKSTNNYYTLGEALEKAKEKYGENDTDYWSDASESQGATPMIFGGDNANEYRFREATGILSGKICMASDRITAIPGAKVNIYKNNKLHTSVTSDENGSYSVELLAGEYYVEISAEGYINFNSYATVLANLNTYMETFLLIQDSEEVDGVASGQILHSISRKGIDNVTLTVFKDWNNPGNESEEAIMTANTNSQGYYEITLELGNYTVVASKDGYITESFNIIVQAGETSNQNGTLTPEVSGNEYLITLTWGENPEDLDSHMEGYLSTGEKFHVYYIYSEHQDYDPVYTPEEPPVDGETVVCRLDCDDIESYGPEHITLSTTTDLPYYYYIHHYKGYGTISSSEAKVTIHQGNVLIAEFNVPTDYGAYDYWNVFAIKNGEIIVSNTMTDTPDTKYAD